MDLVNGCLYVPWRRSPHWNTIGDLQQAHSEKCRRGRVKRQSVFSSALKFKHWTPIYSIFFLSQYGLIMTIGEISMHHFWVFPVHLTLCVAGSGSVPETPRAPWIWFWLLRYNEGAGAWLLRGRVAALQPWPCPNPGKPIPSSLLPRSRLLCWGWKQEQYLLLSEQAGQWAQFNLHSSGLAQEYLHLIGSLVLFFIHMI